MLKKMKDFKKRLVSYYKEEENKKVAIFYTVLRLLVILCLIREIILGNYHNVFLCLLTLVLFIIPFFVEDKFKVTIPNVLEIIILLFIFSAEILGEIQNFYNLIPNWDMILHTLNGFLAAAIGFSLVEIMNNDKRLKFTLSPVFMSVVAFCFSMTIGSLWELFEFGMDQFFHFDMQKDKVVHAIHSVTLDPTKSNIPVTINSISEVLINGHNLGLGGYLDIGLIDSMLDLFVNFIGAFIFSIFGFFYSLKKEKKNFIQQFIPVKKE